MSSSAAHLPELTSLAAHNAREASFMHLRMQIQNESRGSRGPYCEFSAGCRASCSYQGSAVQGEDAGMVQR